MNKTIIFTEARGAHIRPQGCGDYQPAMYNIVQAYMIAADLIKKGKDPYIRLLIDLGLSPEEYSPTDKFIRERLNRDRIIYDFRERHGLEYGVYSKFDSSNTNSAAYRNVLKVKDGEDFDLSDEEVELAKAVMNTNQNSYRDFECAWIKKFLANEDFLIRTIEIDPITAQKLLSNTKIKTYPNTNTTRKLDPIEKDYTKAYVDYIEKYHREITKRFLNEPRDKNIFDNVDNFLRTIGITGHKTVDTREKFCIQLPIDGHITSYFTTKVRNGRFILKRMDRLGLEKEETVMSSWDFIELLSRGMDFATSYPLSLARQIIDRPLVEYISPQMIKVDEAIDEIYIVAERASISNPKWDYMHTEIAQHVGNMLKRKVTPISYPSEKIINPDENGRKRNPRDVGKEIWDKLKDMEIPGIFINI